MTLVESPPDFLQIHWELELDPATDYQFDLNVFNQTSLESTLFENIVGKRSKADLHGQVKSLVYTVWYFGSFYGHFSNSDISMIKVSWYDLNQFLDIFGHFRSILIDFIPILMSYLSKFL